MPPAPPPTIIDLKYAFLRAQVQALSQPVIIPPSYRNERANASEDGAHQLRQKSIDEAMNRLNGMIRQHSKQVYPEMAQRHVAEQIDSLYWEAGQRDTDLNDTEGGGALNKGTDFTTDLAIEHLPETWIDSAEAADEDAQEYMLSAARLRELHEQRRRLREKVQRYRALKQALMPFENPAENVQENLCVKNGELETELERMRMLIARVQGRIEGLEAPEAGVGGDGDGDTLMVDEEEKVGELLRLG
ncbi:MAG: hypothetical protein M1818_004113 [Claussenomyces sp. TS43310]|nr:MAG: hypothetical protein M1818_004113 [Claussenomyces sp. TS43310]